MNTPEQPKPATTVASVKPAEKPVSPLVATLRELRGIARAGKVANVDYWAEAWPLIEEALTLAEKEISK